MSDLCVGALGDLPEVVLGSGGDAAKEDLLRHAASQGHAHAVQQLFFGVQVLLLRQVLGVTQTLPSGDDGHLQGFHRGTTFLSVPSNIQQQQLGNSNPSVQMVTMEMKPRSGECCPQHRRSGGESCELTFSRGSACSRNHPATAWPASW